MTQKPDAPAAVAPVPSDIQADINGLMAQIDSIHTQLQVDQAQVGVPAATSAIVTPSAEMPAIPEDSPATGAGDLLGMGTGGGLEDALGALPLDDMSETDPAASPLADVISMKEKNALNPTGDFMNQNGTGNGAPTVSAQFGNITLNVSGEIQLKLKYEGQGQEVVVAFGSDAFTVQLADGTEFRIPTRATKTRIQAA